VKDQSESPCDPAPKQPENGPDNNEQRYDRGTKYYAYFAVIVLTIAHAIVLASVHVFNILVEPIKIALSISDLELSLLQGFAFGVFAAVIGVPMARIADRGWRRNVAVAGAILWSVGTALCALAATYWQMFFARALIGIGEVFFLPAAISLLAAIVPRKRIALAMGIFISGSNIGSSFAWLGGGWLLANWPTMAKSIPFLSSVEGWRIGFLAFAVLGALASALLFAIREPIGEPVQQRLPLKAEWNRLKALLKGSGRSVVGVLSATVTLAFGSVAVYMWLPSVFVRSFDLDYAAVGQLLGFSFLFFCTTGAWIAGVAADRLRARGRDNAPLLILAVASTCCSLALLLIASSTSLTPLTIVALGVAFAFSAMTGVMGPLALTDVTAGEIRSQALAWQYFLIYLIPVGLAPSAVALITRYVFRDELFVDWSIATVYAITTLVTLAIVFWCQKDYVKRYRFFVKQNESIVL